MPNKPKVARTARSPLSKPIPIRLLPDELEKTDKLAARDMSSRSRFIRIMFLRGLAAYERDLARKA